MDRIYRVLFFVETILQTAQSVVHRKCAAVEDAERDAVIFTIEHVRSIARENNLHQTACEARSRCYERIECSRRYVDHLEHTRLLQEHFTNEPVILPRVHCLVHRKHVFESARTLDRDHPDRRIVETKLQNRVP